MQDTGDALAIKRLTKQSRVCVCVYSCIKTSGYLQTKNLQLIHTNKKNQLKYNTKDSHQTRRGENKRRRKEKRATKTNPKQLIKWQ